MRLIRPILVSLVLSGGACAAQAGAPATGPFGIAVGANPTALGCKLVDASRGFWRCAHPPAPQPGFTQYGVLASPTAGVCHVLAATEGIRDDRAGETTRARVDAAARQLAGKYGAWRTHADTQADGMSQRGASDWLANLRDTRHSYSYTWLSPTMPNDVVMIVLKATALDDATGRVAIEFFLDNPACAAEHDRGAADSTI